MNTLHGKLDPWNPDELEKIHQASLQILATIGVQVHSDKVLDILEGAGAKVDRRAKNAKFPPEMVQDRMAHAPGSWDRRASQYGAFSVSADCGGYVAWDYCSEKPRPVTVRDIVDVPRIVQAMSNIDRAGTLVHLPDVPYSVIDMIGYRHMWNHTAKTGGGGLGRCPSMCHTLNKRSFDYLCDMLQIKIGREKMERDPEFSFFMGIASPLRWGSDILELAMHTIERKQVVGIGGNCTSGIQSPITPASNVVIDHAERLSGLCIVTSIDPAARFYFCNHTYALDMQSADIASGSPEQTLLAFLGRKVLEHCGFQLVVNHPILDVGAHCPDAQASAEKMMYMMFTALGGAGGIGGAGQLKESWSYEQLVIDNEIAGYVKQLLKGAEISEETIALEDIANLGIGGNFLTADATIKFMHECYYPAKLFCRKCSSEWIREGGKNVLTRAHEKVEEILASKTPTFLSQAQLAGMDDIIRRACAELEPEFDPRPYLNV